MKAFPKTIGLTLASALAMGLPALAQDSDAQSQQAGQDSQCIETLNTLAQRMNEDGYWLAGYTGYGVDPTQRTMGGTPPAATSPGTTPPVQDDPARPVDPWGDVTWAERPHYEIRTLFRAANLLANSGDEEACMTVANAAQERYADYTNQLSELGVDPQEVTTWRQAEIAAAVPVTETGFPRRVDDLIGADVRNAQDEDLGDVEDVVIDPQGGGVQYVIVSTGGFLGIGSEEVAVPWEHLRVSSAMNALVLPVSEAAMEQAPRASRQDVDPEQTGSVEQDDEIDSYWDNAINQ
jgi:sporulation protein YlmC with PRC-barrel domain